MSISWEEEEQDQNKAALAKAIQPISTKPFIIIILEGSSSQ
jgi:hypothetical protein